jgi:hypothetical protein
MRRLLAKLLRARGPRPLAGRDDVVPALLSGPRYTEVMPGETAHEAMERLLGPDAVPGPVHAHELTADDAAFMQMMRGARFGDDVTVVLPSGIRITGDEMRRWTCSRGQS